ncbi:hypothetical protein, partial [Pseudomonas syringae]
ASIDDFTEHLFLRQYTRIFKIKPCKYWAAGFPASKKVKYFVKIIAFTAQFRSLNFTFVHFESINQTGNELGWNR